MLTANHSGEFVEFLEEIIANSEFELSKIKFSQQSEWKFINGTLSHISNGFFHVIGLSSHNKKHLMLFQPQGALTGLAISESLGEVFVLLQARIEPGNSRIAQYGPTIQSTPSNFLQMHGGKQTSYLNLFYSYSSLSNPISISTQLDLGERYFQKSKSHVYVETPKLTVKEPNMLWVSLKALVETIDKTNFLNADLRSLLAVFDWDKFLHNSKWQDSQPISNIFQYFFEEKRITNSKHRILPIEELESWVKTEFGIKSLKDGMPSVHLYKTSCRFREVNTWVQPLMAAVSQGLVLLLIRKNGLENEYLLSIIKETGIAGGVVISATYMAYPGEKIDNKYEELGKVRHLFSQSDEGGRFINHEMVYKVIEISKVINVEKNQYWVSGSSLKQVLSMSNMANIQLRTISSALIVDLNPMTF